MRLAIVAIFLAATSVPAAAGGNPPSQTVIVSDLDLSSQEGVAKLDRRIHKAVRNVCSRLYRDDTFKTYRAGKCRRTTGKLVDRQRDAVLADSQRPASFQVTAASGK